MKTTEKRELLIAFAKKWNETRLPMSNAITTKDVDSFHSTLPNEGEKADEEAEKLAIWFHALYEKFAPNFGYETNLETRVFDKSSPNGKLMIAVCKEILQAKQSNPTNQ